MKRASSLASRVLRLVSLAGAMLLSQQALAVGTDAGTTVANQAQVDYDVGGVGQTFILSDPARGQTASFVSQFEPLRVSE